MPHSELQEKNSLGFLVPAEMIDIIRASESKTVAGVRTPFPELDKSNRETDRRMTDRRMTDRQPSHAEQRSQQAGMETAAKLFESIL